MTEDELASNHGLFQSSSSSGICAFVDTNDCDYYPCRQGPEQLNLMGRIIEYPKSRLFNMLQSSVALYFGIFILLHASAKDGRHWGWVVAAVGVGGIGYNGYKWFREARGKK